VEAQGGLLSFFNAAGGKHCGDGVIQHVSARCGLLNRDEPAPRDRARAARGCQAGGADQEVEQNVVMYR